MTFYELSTPKPSPALGLYARVTKALRGMLYTMQYGQLMQAMSQLTDEQLDAICVNRSDIPSVARRILKDEASASRPSGKGD